MHTSRFVLFASCTLFVAAAPAQNDPVVVPGPAYLSYTPTALGISPAGRIKHPEKIYTVRVSGLIAQPIPQGITPTNIVSDGRVLPPSGFRKGFGAIRANHIKPGQRFYLKSLSTDRDKVEFTLVSLDTVMTQFDDDHSGPSRIHMRVDFPLTPQQIAALTPESIHQLTDPIFAEEKNPAP